MTLFLTEREVAQLLPMKECIDVLEQAFAHAGGGDVENKPRSRIRMPNGFFHFMAAADAEHRVFGYKAYPSMGAGNKFIVMLYDYETGQLLACLEAGRLGQIRTGAASGLATRHMARDDAGTVAVIGSGFQARTQLEAVCAVREIRQARVYSRRAERREDFATQMTERLGVEVTPAEGGEQCVAGADVVITITSARDPVLQGDWLAEGAHVNAAGGNHWMRREVDEAVVTRADVVVVDDLEQARAECGDLIWPEARGTFRWDMAHQLQDVVAGRITGRPGQQSITLFESLGVALEDIAAAQLVYRKAVDQGIGQELPF
jgi:ornithine cyclodeaminase/alanine dehydrogenase-like protein (mu-crystallin family)